MSDIDIRHLAADLDEELRTWKAAAAATAVAAAEGSPADKEYKEAAVQQVSPDGNKVAREGGCSDYLGAADSWGDILLLSDDLLEGMLEDEPDGLCSLEGGFMGSLECSFRGSRARGLMDSPNHREGDICPPAAMVEDGIGMALESGLALETGGSLQSTLTGFLLGASNGSPQSLQAHSPHQGCKRESEMGAPNAAGASVTWAKDEPSTKRHCC